MAPRPLIVGNWKMNKTIAEARSFAHELSELELPESVDVVIAPPFMALDAVARALAGSRIGVAGQTMSAQSQGAYTGEISPVMLRDAGATWVILGHSERRAMCGETDAGVRAKVEAALAFDLSPVVAVGETLEEHRAGKALERVTAQTRAAFEGLSDEAVRRCIVAYEPIWAIGSGMHDEPASAGETIAAIRRSVTGLAGARLLYGGSMKAENAAGFLAEDEIAGGLVGGASLTAGGFRGIVLAAGAIRAARANASAG